MGEVIDLDEYRRRAAQRKARRDKAAERKGSSRRSDDPRGSRGRRDTDDRGPEKTPKK